MFQLDINSIDPKFKKTVEAIENKPHVRYIRYLMSKRYSPISIKRELIRLGLSSSHEPNLIVYYLAVMDPEVRKFGLGPLYADYKNKLLRKNKKGEFAKDVLNYRLDIDDNLDNQVKLCKFAKHMGIDDLWLSEIYRYHGSASRMPVDENGVKIIEVNSSKKVIDKILLSPKRYLVDKMILENVPDTRISEYCRDKMELKINAYDVAAYKKSFFNIKTQTIEEKIKSLEIEKSSLSQLLKNIDEVDEDEYDDMDIGERVLIKRQTAQRIEDLADNIKTLNMMYSEFAFKAATEDKNNFQSIFTDVVLRSYSRFCQLDAYKDRDVVDCLFKTAKMMSFTHDKLDAISLTNKNGTEISDVHSQEVLIELYKKRIDEIANEEVNRANNNLVNMGYEIMDPNVNPDDVGGIEELGMSFGDDNENPNE